MGREKKGEFKTRGSEEKHGAVKMKKSEFYARIKSRLGYHYRQKDV